MRAHAFRARWPQHADAAAMAWRACDTEASAAALSASSAGALPLGTSFFFQFGLIVNLQFVCWKRRCRSTGTDLWRGEAARRSRTKPRRLLGFRAGPTCRLAPGARGGPLAVCCRSRLSSAPWLASTSGEAHAAAWTKEQSAVFRTGPSCRLAPCARAVRFRMEPGLHSRAAGSACAAPAANRQTCEF